MFEAWQSSCIRCSFLPFFSLFFIERSKNIRPFPCSFSVTNSSLLCCCLCVISFSSLFRYINVIVVRGNNRKKDTCSWCYGEQRDRYNMHHAPCCASSLLLNAKMIVTQFQSNSKAPAAAATTAQEMLGAWRATSSPRILVNLTIRYFEAIKTIKNLPIMW